MRQQLSTLILGTLAIPLFPGCQPSAESTSSSASPVAPAAAPSATTNAASMKLVIMTEIYDSNGESQDQEIESMDATPDVLTERFRGLDWNHPANRYGIAISGGDINSTDRKKLSIAEELPEGSSQTVLAARLEETPPDASSEKYYTFQPIESPDIALKLLVSFLAQDGAYRTMVDWQEQ